MTSPGDVWSAVLAEARAAPVLADRLVALAGPAVEELAAGHRHAAVEAAGELPGVAARLAVVARDLVAALAAAEAARGEQLEAEAEAERTRRELISPGLQRQLVDPDRVVVVPDAVQARLRAVAARAETARRRAGLVGRQVVPLRYEYEHLVARLGVLVEVSARGGATVDVARVVMSGAAGG